MKTKVENAVERLNHILPLKERQEQCPQEIKDVHQQVLRSFVSKGRCLTREEMATFVEDLDETTTVLQNNDMVIFSENGQPLGAYPFTMEPREHHIQVNGHHVYAMCALDALAISPMFGMDTEIQSRCRITGTAINIQQSGETVKNWDEVNDIYVGIAWGATNTSTCCANSLCLEMIFLGSNEIAEQWLANSDHREIFTLAEAINFAEHVFVPLLH